MNSSASLAPTNSIWAELKAALAGTDADYTRIPLRRAVLLLAAPMVLELVLESTFALADIYFVSQLGPSAVASVGLTETYLFLVYSIAMGVATAVTAVIARRIGEGRSDEAAISAVQAILLALLISLPITWVGLVASKALMGWMGADAWSLTHGYRYTQWMLGGNAIILLLFVINAIFRGSGDAAVAMKILLVANSINLVLDPLLIFGWGPFPALGIQGAAIATQIGRSVAVAMQMWLLWRGSERIKILPAQIIWRGSVIWHLAQTSIGGIGQMVVATTSWLFLMRILSSIATEAVAGATIAMRIMMFTLMPAWGMANAAATLVGQHLGAGTPDRAEAAVWYIGRLNMIFTGLISVLFFFGHDTLMAWMTHDQAVIRIGGQWLSILSYSYFVYGWWMVSVQAFNGAGDTMTPTLINLVFFWMIQIPLAWWLAGPMEMAHLGVFWSVFFSETSVGLFTLWMFSRGRWKTVQV